MLLQTILLDAAAPADMQEMISSATGTEWAICLAGLAVLAAVIVLVRIRRKKKHKKNDTESEEK